MSGEKPSIIYTLTDEAPLLATYAFLPVVRTFAGAAGIDVQTSDISVAARILAEFSDYLTDEQKVPDNLGELGRLTQSPDTNIIKLPNISASVPQLVAAIKELKEKGYNLPDYPGEPKTDEEKAIKDRYGKCLGSAVNPVLREGNSDRRAPKAVKEYARKHPHSMGKWSQASRTHVATMKTGDFYHGEQSMTLDKARNVKMVLKTKAGKTIELKPLVKLDAGDIIDSMYMSKKALIDFYEEQMDDAYKTGVMFSLHVKATMMKVSHPIVFGHAVRIFYKDAFAKHQKLFDELDVNVNNGLSDLYDKISSLPKSLHDEIVDDLHKCHEHRPELAMVDSARGITNFHSPSDVIVDASMPAMIRLGGKMYGADGKLKDTKAVNPESTFSRMYQEIINFCKTHGQFDPTTMGTVPNVGLMAQKAEEYGSHDKTFEIAEDGIANIVDIDSGEVLLTTAVEAGDIWRMPVVKDAPIRDWVKLAVTRTRLSGMPVVFWLDQERPHEAELRKKVATYLKDHDTEGLDISVMSQERAMRHTVERAMRGQDTIAATGNILRDYLTDLFPILELGTSAKMLSIVPLMAGGGLYETGAGGSAPKHVQQLVEENHLRWDSLGEFLALGASLEDLGNKTDDAGALLLAKTLDSATGKLLDENKSPSRRTGELDNRGSQFYLAMYWAQELARQTEDTELAAKFAPLAKALAANEEKIVAELAVAQGSPADIGGYYAPDPDKTSAVMRPSATFNSALAAF
ncbi:NADP-dependent isocitrate dehydrogenase [Mycobacterium sp. CBMA293]|uniref:NADP-dependent isocitrate dehydrogenase n=2 Tax=Mycolicibacterium TaxID=1866885 RepID=UPI0012DC10DF|nr:MULTISPECIES: NADP-dependent isocitrate dehydrogenase [unclassified Mycolicibacterium]MUL48304.1 NADP-dependent isocitrate dehydrogenase [Mycolicibacterium sp. CBMA 360]MUL57529.1 NADP-dependent isocitrate dehydrogenase [Mycolicibacterium sp. CBMA 335]MUL70569.1 NADP-dependent isocitrate dehydrogenase [Mycolicibacterium sp. CBMA 311]MUL92617.1 NADP-dependent isocitrate dehydrogenase [Mycolicibacterium sp. CBMA 230]MUM04994.1 isocitrate dehydrogenase (NADP(+)) [Mycolicibacterium sp. CBMA 213